MNDPRDVLRAAAIRLGFDLVGFARADLDLTDDFTHYSAFVEAGMHGSMQWLAAHASSRRSLHTDAVLDGAKSVVCVAERHASSDDFADPGVLPRIARYGRGRDYHNHFRRRVRKLAEAVRALGDGVQARPMVDTAPVLERAWATRAGLGFVGKSGMLISLTMGSYLSLGEVVTTLAIEPDRDEPLPSRCGRCTRCLDACPTAAFVAPYVIDARRCVSYLTIEHKGPCDPSLAGGVSPWLFGCDRCQEVCPYNRFPDVVARPGSRFAPLDRWAKTSLLELATIAQDAWTELATGTPLSRISVVELRRNIVMAAGAEPDPDSMRALAVIADDADNPSWLRTLALRCG